MKLTLFRLAGTLALATLAAAQVNAAPTSRNTEKSGASKSEKTSQAQVRRMTIVRTGWYRAKPDSATIEVPYQVEGISWEEVEKKRKEMKLMFEAAVKQYDSKSGAVNESDGHSGQVFRDGKTLTNYTGNFAVYVRDLTRFKPLLIELSKRTTSYLTVRCNVANIATTQSAFSRAQINAIEAARWQADRLAKAAGTRIVGVWELHEGEFKVVSSTEVPFSTVADCELPMEVDVASAEITIVFEMAPSLLVQSRPK